LSKEIAQGLLEIKMINKNGIVQEDPRCALIASAADGGAAAAAAAAVGCWLLWRQGVSIIAR